MSYYSRGINVTTSSNTLKLLRNNASNNSVGISVANSNNVELQENLASANLTTGIVFSSVIGCVYRGNSAQGSPTNYSVPGSGVTNAGGNY